VDLWVVGWISGQMGRYVGRWKKKLVAGWADR
jgi:hypothetical protein